jgi:hypothetical protein
VNENLLYTLVDTEGDPNQKVVSYDGSTWGPLPVAYTPYQVEHLWADEENVFCAGPDGTIISLEDGEWRIHDTRTLEDFYAIWGFGGADVWAGTDGGDLLHYDGESWTSVEWPCLGEYCEINAMWGDEGVLFFHDNRQLTMWDGTSFKVLLFSDAEAGSRLLINAIWGNSPTEVFLAVQDEGHPNPQCGIYYLLWWDGSEFHWF